ncbi:hypothetical protein [Bacillus sp. EB01]|uniref:hypothetical protein n=1 Tax=Bacillus sp. EB01 TaxID=1347086 RepID=UPI0005C46BCF|nr:hypothetical protein [Bacillus sp. EB01]
MNILQINIFDAYLNWDDYSEIERKLRHTGVYATEENVKQVEKHLRDLIMDDKNDGIKVEINSYNNHHFIDVFLFLSIDNQGDKEYDIRYINDYLDSHYETITENIRTEEVYFDNYLYIECPSEEMEEIIKDINQGKYDVHIVSENKITIEKGFSTFMDGFLLGIAQNASWDMIKMSLTYLSAKYGDVKMVEVRGLNHKALRANVAKAATLKEHQLQLVSFDETEEAERFEAIYRSATEKFTVTSNIEGDLLKFSRETVQL